MGGMDLEGGGGKLRGRIPTESPPRPEGALGPSLLDGKGEEIRRLLKFGVSRTAVAKVTGMSRATLHNFMRMRLPGTGRRRAFQHESGQNPLIGPEIRVGSGRGRNDPFRRVRSAENGNPVFKSIPHPSETGPLACISTPIWLEPQKAEISHITLVRQGF